MKVGKSDGIGKIRFDVDKTRTGPICKSLKVPAIGPVRKTKTADV